MHRNTFLTWLRRNYNPLEYVWFLEFQKREAPHFHLLLNVSTPDDNGQIRAGKAWVEIASKAFPSTRESMLRVHTFVGPDRDRMWSNIREKDGASRYMRKYAGKESQKKVPCSYSDVGRFWGTSRGAPAKVDEGVLFSASEKEVRALISALGRESVAKWAVIPRYIHT